MTTQRHIRTLSQGKSKKFIYWRNFGKVTYEASVIQGRRTSNLPSHAAAEVHLDPDHDKIRGEITNDHTAVAGYVALQLA